MDFISPEWTKTNSQMNNGSPVTIHCLHCNWLTPCLRCSTTNEEEFCVRTSSRYNPLTTGLDWVSLQGITCSRSLDCDKFIRLKMQMNVRNIWCQFMANGNGCNSRHHKRCEARWPRLIPDQWLIARSRFLFALFYLRWVLVVHSTSLLGLYHRSSSGRRSSLV